MAAAFGAEVEFNFKRNYPLINHAPETAFAVRVMQNRQGYVDAAVRKPPWAQDFAFIAAQTGLLCLS
jgi:hippurate hydrolase